MKGTWMIAVTAALMLGVTGLASAETKVTLTGVHLCCGGCAKGVEKAIGKVDGVTVTCDRKGGSATITAPDVDSAQKALDALADAGFHGQSDHATVKIKDNSGAPDKQVDSLKVTGAHLCCGSCVKGVNKALNGVKGVESTDAQKNGESFVIKGTFNAAEAIKALNAAGYHVKVAE